MTTEHRRLRVLPEEAAPVIIDPPGGAEIAAGYPLDAFMRDTLTPDDWRAGWNACRVVVDHETRAAYERGLEARQVTPMMSVGVLACSCSAFIVGFVVAIAVLA